MLIYQLIDYSFGKIQYKFILTWWQLDIVQIVSSVIDTVSPRIVLKVYIFGYVIQRCQSHQNYSSLGKGCVTLGEIAGSAFWLNNQDVKFEACLPYSPFLAAPPSIAQQKKHEWAMVLVVWTAKWPFSSARWLTLFD